MTKEDLALPTWPPSPKEARTISHLHLVRARQKKVQGAMGQKGGPGPPFYS